MSLSDSAPRLEGGSIDFPSGLLAYTGTNLPRQERICLRWELIFIPFLICFGIDPYIVLLFTITINVLIISTGWGETGKSHMQNTLHAAQVKWKGICLADWTILVSLFTSACRSFLSSNAISIGRHLNFTALFSSLV